jgi:hypothetical protein
MPQFSRAFWLQEQMSYIFSQSKTTDYTATSHCTIRFGPQEQSKLTYDKKNTSYNNQIINGIQKTVRDMKMKCQVWRKPYKKSQQSTQ